MRVICRDQKMLPSDYLTTEGQNVKTDSKKFLGEVMIALLNILNEKKIFGTYCCFLGNNDVVLFRGTNTMIFSFSRSKQTVKPLFSEYLLSEVIKDEEQLNVDKATYFENESLSSNENYKEFLDPITIAFPVSYLSLKNDELKKAHREIAELLVNPTKDDSEKQLHIVRVNPIFRGRNFLKEEALCFVLIPFESPYTEIYETIIKPTVEAEGFRCLKSDDIFSTTSVIEDIWENINKASIVIAEISDNNANVMYELGICHTVGKDVMMITQNPEKIPFNFRHLRSYPYKNDIAGSVELKKNITSMIQHIKSTK